MINEQFLQQKLLKIIGQCVKVEEAVKKAGRDSKKVPKDITLELVNLSKEVHSIVRR